MVWQGKSNNAKKSVAKIIEFSLRGKTKNAKEATNIKVVIVNKNKNKYEGKQKKERMEREEITFRRKTTFRNLIIR